MTKDKVQERLNTLEQELKQAVRIVHAYEGAIEDCKFWLANFDKPVEEEKNT